MLEGEDRILTQVPGGCLLFPSHLKIYWVWVLVSFSFVSNRYFVGRLMRQKAIIPELPMARPQDLWSGKGVEMKHSGDDSFREQHLLCYT